jgi:hypothetical protein
MVTKPWECALAHPRVPRNPAERERLQELTNLTTCGLLIREYFLFRQDIEKRIGKASETPFLRAIGTFHPEYFLGYCNARGYQSIELQENFDMKQVYGF